MNSVQDINTMIISAIPAMIRSEPLVTENSSYCLIFREGESPYNIRNQVDEIIGSIYKERMGENCTQAMVDRYLKRNEDIIGNMIEKTSPSKLYKFLTKNESLIYNMLEYSDSDSECDCDEECYSEDEE